MRRDLGNKIEQLYRIYPNRNVRRRAVAMLTVLVLLCAVLAPLLPTATLATENAGGAEIAGGTEIDEEEGIAAQSAASEGLETTDVESVDHFYLWLKAYEIDRNGNKTMVPIKLLPSWVRFDENKNDVWDGSGIEDALTYTDADNETWYLIPISYFGEYYGEAYGYSFDPENTSSCPFCYAPNAQEGEGNLTSASYVQVGEEWYVRIQDNTENVDCPRSNIYYTPEYLPVGTFRYWLYKNGEKISTGNTDITTALHKAGTNFYLVPVSEFSSLLGDGFFDPEGTCPFQYTPDANYGSEGFTDSQYVQVNGIWYLQIEDTGTYGDPPRSNIYYTHSEPVEVSSFSLWLYGKYANSSNYGKMADYSGDAALKDVYSAVYGGETYYLIPVSYFETVYGSCGYIFDENDECPFTYDPDAVTAGDEFVSADYVKMDGKWYIRVQDRGLASGSYSGNPRSNVYYIRTDNAFTLTFSGSAITFCVVDGSGDPIAGAYADIEAEAGTKYVFGAASGQTGDESGAVVENVAPVISGYDYSGAKLAVENSEHAVASVATTGYINCRGSANGTVSGFQFYISEPMADGGWYSRSGNQTVTLTYTKPLKVLDTSASHPSSVIHLFDYWTTAQTDPDNVNYPTSGINKDHALKFVLNGGGLGGAWNIWTGSAKVYQGIVANKLADGYPRLSGDEINVFVPAENKTLVEGEENTDKRESLAYLFDPDGKYDVYRKTYRNVSGLLQVDENGYYYYNSGKNFAEYDEDTNSFLLYEKSGVLAGGGASTEGQFFPFNKAEEVLGLQSTNSVMNHYFGLTLTTRFIQQNAGYIDSGKNVPMEFDFSGDDDVWIFIDDVLVADLGGNHNAASVTINFAAGTVEINEGIHGQSTTLYQAFVAADSYDEDAWQTVTVNGETQKIFADNTVHTLKFYYLERGNTDSNLYLKYNLTEVPQTAINKVDQYGKVVEGATFAVYAADDEYNMLYKLNGDKVNLPGSYTYNLDSDSENYGDIIGTDGEILAKALYVGTTDAKGEMIFLDEDQMPHTLNELEKMFGDHFILKEIAVPDGYRMVSDVIQLRIINHQVLFCDNTYESGIYTAPNLLVSAPNHIMLASMGSAASEKAFPSGDYVHENEDGRTIIDYYTDSGDKNGTIFAVVLKYIGPEENKEGELGKAENWAPLYGTSKDGFVLADVDGDYGGDFISAAIDTAKKYVESGNEFTLSSQTGQMQGTINGMPGDITTYYYMLGAGEKSKTQYTVAYYWSSADSLKEAESRNTYRIDADKDTAGDSYAFSRSFGSTISVPNLINVLYVQKFDAEGNAVNGAGFAMYEVKEIGNDTTSGNDTTVYYIADDGTLIYLGPDSDGDNEGTALIAGSVPASGTVNKWDTPVRGTYLIDPDSAAIKVSGSDGSSYTISAEPYAINGAIAKTEDKTTDKYIGENGSGYFTNMLNGTYYVREIYAPAGYGLNTAEVMVLVDASAVYANAGTADDGIMVGRGSGYVVSTLDQFASQGDIDNTLSWIFEMMRISPVSTSFKDSDFSDGSVPDWGYLIENGDGVNLTEHAEDGPRDDNALRVYLAYENHPTTALFNYGLNEGRYKDSNGVRRRLYTDVGWSYYEIYQDFRWALGYEDAANGIQIESHKREGANYDILTSDETIGGQLQEIANLFSRTTYIQVTDQKISNLEISKEVVDETQTVDTEKEFTFAVTLYVTSLDEEGNPIETKLTDSYPYTVYDIDADGDRTSAVDSEGNPLTGTVASGDTISLKQGQVAVIEKLPAEAYYRITEDSYKNFMVEAVRDRGKDPAAENDTDTGEKRFESNEVSGRLYWSTDENGVLLDNTSTVEYTNIYVPNTTTLQIIKQDAEEDESGEHTRLNGVEFQLEKLLDDGTDQPDPDFEVKIKSTSEYTEGEEPEEGVVLFNGLSNGTYRLTEIKTAEGYSLLKDPIIIEIYRSEKGNYYIVDGKQIDLGESDTIELTVNNQKSMVLPATGGNGHGILYCVVLGGLILHLAILLLYIYDVWKGGRNRRRYQ